MVIDKIQINRIKKEASDILDKFGLMLKNIESPKIEIKKELGGFRFEEDSVKRDEDFRVRIFENAPKKNNDCIIAEKKTW